MPDTAQPQTRTIPQTRTTYAATHWGLVTRVPGDSLSLAPFAGDPVPSPLMEGLAEALTGPNRIRRPAFRRGWLEGRRETRGQDDYVDVPWDEALDAIEERLRATLASHGNSGIFAGSYGWGSAGRFHHAQTQMKRFLNTIGGFVDQRQTYSYAAGQIICPHVTGDNRILFGGETTSWPAILENARTIVFFGGLNPGNMQVASGGLVHHHSLDYMRAAAKAGIRMISVSPRRDHVEGVEGLEWVPIRPNTDTALMLAVAHELIATGRADRAFLDRYTVGYEALAAYVAGRDDGIAKTPAWAAPICGIAEDRIRALAADMAAGPVFLTASWSLQRQENGEQPLWMLIALAAMLGEIGLPGRGVSFGYGSMGNRGLPRPLIASPHHQAGRNPTGLFIPVSRLADMLLNPGKTIPYDCGTITYPEIDLVFWAGSNPFHHHQDLNRLREGLKRPSTLIAVDLWWTATARHADIVLPAASGLERNDISTSPTCDHLVASKAQMDRVGEARTEFEIFSDLARRFGTGTVFSLGRGERAWLKAIYEEFRSQSAEEMAHLPDFDTFWEAGFVHIPPKDPRQTLYTDFREDPAKHPLATPSGRFELYSQRIADAQVPGFAPHPVWRTPEAWAAEPEDALHLLSTQPPHRLHSQLEGTGVSAAVKIGGREPVTLNPADAAARGIAAGDTVLLSNSQGRCLAAAVLSEDLCPGSISLPTGAWYAPDAGGMCLGGNPNVLTEDRPTSALSQGPAPHSTRVQVSRWVEAAAG